MRDKIQVFDVDGTLTHSEKDIPYAFCNLLAYKTFSFWPLLSLQFSRDPLFFEIEAAQWNKSMETTPDDQKDISSFQMMDRTIKEFLYPYVNAQNIIERAEQITENFLKHNVVQLHAIHYIDECLKNGIICILTTGSYLDGLQGFVNALVKSGHLSTTKNLLLNGAEVDWEKRRLIRANVGAYKTENLFHTLTAHNINDYVIQATFGDDPYINDKAILEMGLPDKGFVIKCKKNEKRGFNSNFHHCTWEEFFIQHKQRILLCQ